MQILESAFIPISCFVVHLGSCSVEGNKWLPPCLRLHQKMLRRSSPSKGSIETQVTVCRGRIEQSRTYGHENIWNSWRTDMDGVHAGLKVLGNPTSDLPEFLASGGSAFMNGSNVIIDVATSFISQKWETCFKEWSTVPPRATKLQGLQCLCGSLRKIPRYEGGETTASLQLDLRR